MGGGEGGSGFSNEISLRLKLCSLFISISSRVDSAARWIVHVDAWLLINGFCFKIDTRMFLIGFRVDSDAR